MKIDGGCHCGYITYEADADPERTSICHCTDCQVLTGTAFRISIPAPDHDFRILSGEPTVYVKTGESGNKRAQAFCPRCGSPIYATAPGDGPNNPCTKRTKRVNSARHRRFNDAMETTPGRGRLPVRRPRVRRTSTCAPEPMSPT